MIEQPDTSQPANPFPNRDQTPVSHPEDSHSGQGIVRAAAILAIGNIASRLLGLARQTVKASLFGASGRLSAFEVAAFVPLSLYELIVGGMVNAALVPVFSDYASKERRNELWGVLSTVLSVATIVLLLVVALVELFAPQIAWLVGANEFQNPLLTDAAIRLMRMAAPTILFLGIASVLTGALFALRRFTIPAFLGAAFNGTIVIIALLRPDQISSLVWGMLLGSILQVVMQWAALRDARLRWRFDWRHPAVRRILRLYAPILAGLIVNQLAIALSYNLATRTGDQSISFMKFATTLYQFPLGLVVTALSVATLPTLARQANGQLAAFKQTLSEGLRLVVTLILPATAGLFALAVPIVSLLFEHGEFTAQDSETTGLVLRVYLIGLPFAAVDQMLIFSSYARKDTWRPALVGVISIVIYSVAAVVLLPPLGLLSLMFADSIKHISHTLMMLWVVRGQIGGLKGYGIPHSILKSIAAAVVTGMVAFGAERLIATILPFSGFSQTFLIVSCSAAAGLLAYTVMVFTLNITEAKALPRLLSRRSTS
ncbi:MAG: murein biosynthesis integral membrane protein MurJ [Candidatus Promineifilaceae bacterium]|nr:murein biosynthesis integral membrane protein MurJ [Candidatus Promineifilaceae bacterium]